MTDSRIPGIAWGLAALALVLPSFEAPKNLLLAGLALYAVTIGRHALARSVKGADAIEWALFAMLGATALSIIWNWKLLSPGSAFKDVATQALVCWVAYRLLPTGRGMRRVGAAICLGTVLGLVYGAWEALQGKHPLFEFHVVGAAPRSAIYLGIATFVGIGLLVFPTEKGWSPKRMLLMFAVIGMFVAIWLMGSRGGVLALIIALAIVASTLGGLRRLFVAVAALLASCLVAFTLPNAFVQDRLLQKVRTMFVEYSLPGSDSERVSVWKATIAKIHSGQDLIFGVGPERFRQVFDHTALSNFGHAHNLFLNKLLEEGVLGMCALLAFFVVIALRLYKGAARGEITWLWIAAVGALVIPIVGGSFNSPFMKAHALLSMMVLGMWAASAGSKDVRVPLHSSGT